MWFKCLRGTHLFMLLKKSVHSLYVFCKHFSSLHLLRGIERSRLTTPHLAMSSVVAQVACLKSQSIYLLWEFSYKPLGVFLQAFVAFSVKACRKTPKGFSPFYRLSWYSFSIDREKCSKGGSPARPFASSHHRWFFPVAVFGSVMRPSWFSALCKREGTCLRRASYESARIYRESLRVG